MSAPPESNKPVEKLKPVWVRCSQCAGRPTNHKVLYRDQRDFVDGPEGDWSHSAFSDLIQCMGCDSIKLHTYYQEPDYHGERDFLTTNDRIYPGDDRASKKRKTSIAGLRENDEALIPRDVHKMYLETLDAFDAKCNTLAGVGLRATVEAICLERGIKSGNLEAKINELADKRLLALPDAELLHEERYLGNAAVHEMATPSGEDLVDGLEIIEGLINTIYVLQPKAQRMREKRESKKVGETHSNKRAQPKKN